MASQTRRATYYAADAQDRVYPFHSRKLRDQFCQYGTYRPVPASQISVELTPRGQNQLAR